MALLMKVETSLLVAAMACAPLCGVAAAQQTDFEPARTLAGAPDMQGVWSAHFITPLERAEGVEDLVAAPEQEAEIVGKLTYKPDGVYDPDEELFQPDRLMSLNGELRTSLIVEPRDGRLPYSTLAKLAKERARDDFKFGYDNPEERPTMERCVSSFGHPPMHARNLVIPYQIVQTPEAVVIVTEDGDSARIVHIDGARPPDAIRTRAGHSIGQWDGDTLVVNTTHFAARDPSGALFRDAVLVTEGSRVTERLTPISDTQLLYQFSVEDPALYTRDWLAEFVLTRQEGRLYEYACHEGNSSMASILLAGRMGRQPKPTAN